MKPWSMSGGAMSVPRRRFLKGVALTGAAIYAFPTLLKASPARKKLNIAVIGAGGKGAGDTDAVGFENIVALCDPDGRRLDGRLQKYPKAKGYQDYRRMLEDVGKSLDAVVISAPDHHHGLASALAMRMGLHVFCQKPLAHNIQEARLLRRLAAEQKLVTQMGNQGSAHDGLRRAVELIQAGVIGPVREAHAWSNRPIWPQGIDRPAGEDPIPTQFLWDAWSGPASRRPFKQDVYHPFRWRGWYDFGTGALGDMACHTLNLPFRALNLGLPELVECEQVSDVHEETFPKSSRIRFEFPARGELPALKCWWHDGGWKPGAELLEHIPKPFGRLSPSGCLLVGEQGSLFSPDDYGTLFWLKLKGDEAYVPGDRHPATVSIKPSLPRIHSDHFGEWLRGIRGGPAPYSNFEIAGTLTEIVLLGNVAIRHGAGRKIEWDGATAKARNADLASLLKREYRSGWELPV